MRKVVYRIVTLMCAGLLAYAGVSEATVTIQHVTVSARVRETHVIFDLSGPFRYRSFTLARPDRLVIDIPDAKYQAKIIEDRFANTMIQDVRMAEHPAYLRLVFDLKKKVKIQVYAKKASGATPYRLVVACPLGASVPATLLPKAIKVTKTTKATPIQITQVKRSRKVIVVIDPGHGGKDPGATGRRGYHEKNVVLGISKKLAQLINAQPGYVAKLTRTGDYYLSLRQRLAIARRYKADLFVAIHADAYKNRQARGVSVFALSQRGATSEAARWLADRENKSELMGGVNLADKTNLLKSVLIDLSQNATVQSSVEIGQDIKRRLSRIARLHQNKVEQAAFVVLKSPDIPSLLIETGFLSNTVEEKLLASSSYQWKLARAIESGVFAYYTQNPPRGTWLAERSSKFHMGLYRVKRGDTLGGLALRFDTSLSELMKLNQLSSRRIYIGQELAVPNNQDKG